MIILKHLTVERFRLLRGVDLHFPQRGSILVQGENEAGKSTLFESIYFALYGESLATGQGRRTLDDLVPYGETRASVNLTLAVGATEMTIAREIERGKGQTVTLYVRRLGMPEERPITDIDVANERIVVELGQLDGETLRNSCFIEQKGLGRLEQLDGVARETSLRKLLGLDKLSHLSERFKLTPDDEYLLADTAERLKLAEIQARIPELSQKLGEIEAALDAVTINETLAAIGQEEADITEQEGSIVEIGTKRADLKTRQGRVQQLKKADAVLAEIASAYDAMAEARRELPELDRQIAELDRREREELPALEKRVHDLEDLTSSFGTLERMAADLLTAVNTIKELELELKEHRAFQESVEALDEQIAQARTRVEAAQQGLLELEERRRSGRPNLEARLRRMQSLAERLNSLRQVEERYVRRMSLQGQAQENDEQIELVRKELQEVERELARAEAESRQAQQKADSQEKLWRELSLTRQLEEWIRLKGLNLGLAQAQQHVEAAHQRKAELNREFETTRRASGIWLILVIGCGVLFLAFAGFALFEMVQQAMLLALVALLFALGVAVFGVLSFMQFQRAHSRRQLAERTGQEASNQLSMMVVARDAAARAGGSQESINQIEQEIRSLGASIPRSSEEARRYLDQHADRSTSIVEVQKQLADARENAATARDQVGVSMEAATAVRKKLAALEEQSAQSGWDDINGKLRSDLIAVEQARHELATLMGEEGLPIPTFEAAVFNSAAKYAELKQIIDSAIQATEQEIASLDGKVDLVATLQAQQKVHQEALNALLTRQQIIDSRRERFQSQDPLKQIERAREQQMALRDALRSLQDSLRQRVKLLNVPFGQAAISSAETAVRKELEVLNITLGRRVQFQGQRTTYATTLKERQESLAGHYRQLAKFSGSLGGWVVPPNPFAETLANLRGRCQKELEESREGTIEQELASLEAQEGASKAKVELCRQEIEEAQARISSLLEQHARPKPKSYLLNDIMTVWPLVGEHTRGDRERLDAERLAAEQELQRLERQELELSVQLRTGGSRLDLEQARSRMEQQERSYQTKKRGGLLIDAVIERMLRKMTPRTEYYVQLLLPLLTGGRYHDARLSTESEEGTVSGGAFQLRVWDSGAGEYVPMSALSGGTADQISFALRLAFAIAALPRELSAAPGFLLLDEPLTSFDRARTQTLIDVVTGEMLGQHFEQILFISHSSAFDPALFPYHVLVDGGQIVASNLPVVSPPAQMEVEEDEEPEPEPASIAVES